MKAKNLLPENSHFRGCIEKFMNENKEIKERFEVWLKKQEEE